MSQDLEARVKALEDTLQRITQVLLAPPTSKPAPENDLEYTEKDGKTIIKPVNFLSKERFKEVTEKVKKDGGKYVPATNDTPGHWEVPT